METKKYEYIDSLRGIAILLVILVHVQFIQGISLSMSYFPMVVSSFIENGRLGVQLFFIVSAFTLMMSHQRRQNEDHATRNFFIRRFFRIAPMYYLAIVYFTFANFTGFENPDWSSIPKKELLLNVFFINGFFPQYIHHYVPGGWSITVEFAFYAMFPFLFSKIKSLNSALVFTLATLLFCTIADFALRSVSSHLDEFLKHYIIAQLPVFSLGILAYFINKEKGLTLKPYVLLLIGLVVFMYSYVALPYHFLYSIAFFMLLITLIKKPYAFLSNKILASIGKVSFSLYLMHFVVMGLFNRFGCFSWVNVSDTGSAYLFFIVGYLVLFAVSFVLSNITYRLIEVPGQNLGRTLINKLTQVR